LFSPQGFGKICGYFQRRGESVGYKLTLLLEAVEGPKQLPNLEYPSMAYVTEKEGLS
jgi:hypothetical protein